MRFTQSSDGVLRANIWSQHRVGLAEIVEAIAAEWGSDFREEPVLTRRVVESTMRAVLTKQGAGAWVDWNTNLWSLEAEAIEEWAKEQALRLFPELWEGP